MKTFGTKAWPQTGVHAIPPPTYIEVCRININKKNMPNRSGLRLHICNLKRHKTSVYWFILSLKGLKHCCVYMIKTAWYFQSLFITAVKFKFSRNLLFEGLKASEGGTDVCVGVCVCERLIYHNRHPSQYGMSLHKYVNYSCNYTLDTLTQRTSPR